ncbi:hypothetical protein WA158_008193 [Blastocystis sp. Blastoise]
MSLLKANYHPFYRTFSSIRGEHDSEHDIKDTSYWVKKGNQVTAAGAGVNLGLAASKWTAGIMLHSPSLVADGIHSLSDLLSDFITLAVVKLARKPPNKLFPYGFGRVESIGAVSISICLLGAGLYVGWDSFQSLLSILHGSTAFSLDLKDIQSLLVGPGVLVMSLVLKEVLFRWTLKVGNKCSSPSLIANAWHHRTDSISAGIALIGVLGRYFGYPFLDPIAGIIVGGFICHIGLDYLIHNSIYILDGNDTELYNKYSNILSLSPHIPKYKDLRVHICVILPSDTHLEQAIVIEKRLNELLHSISPNVKEVLVHYTCDQGKSIHNFDCDFIVPPQVESKHDNSQGNNDNKVSN